MTPADEVDPVLRNMIAVVPGRISRPLSLSTTQVWNCSGGVQTSATDANAKTTSLGFADPNFWRPTQATFPNGGSSYYSYPNATTVVRQQDQNSANDRGLRTQTLSDGFGRVIETDRFESGSPYIATTQSYDALERLAMTTNPSRYTNGTGDGLNYETAAMTGWGGQRRCRRRRVDRRRRRATRSRS
jgi:hypothetical protein